jgi:hypothetical protein
MAAFTTLAVLSVLSTGKQIHETKQAAKESRKAEELKNRITDIQAQRSKRKQIRAALSERARVVNQAAQTGTATSSSAVSGAASTLTQAASNVGFIGSQTSLASEASKANIRSAEHRSKASIFGAASSVFATFAGPEGFENLGNSIFKE